MTATQISLPLDQAGIEAQLNGFEQSLGQTGEVLGYTLADANGTVLAGGTDDFKADRFAVVDAMRSWEPGLEQEAQTVVNVSANVLRLSDQVKSGYMSFEDAQAFAAGV